MLARPPEKKPCISRLRLLPLLAALVLISGCEAMGLAEFDWNELRSWRGISWFPWFSQEEAAGERPRGLIETRIAALGHPVGNIDPRLGLDDARAYLSDALAAHGRHLGEPIYMRIFKETAELEIWARATSPTNADGQDASWTHIATYEICAFSGDLGPKLATGDRQSPEGLYQVSANQLNPASNYHLSFNLGYPNALDRALGRTGSYLMVHGDCVSIGCYAMTDGGIEEIYAFAEAALAAGQPRFRVDVFPARLTDAWLAARAGSQWYNFWADLKPCYDSFENHRRLVSDAVSNGRYVCG